MMKRKPRQALQNPLAPSTYLLRNKGKTMPLVGVILLAVMLIAGIVSMIDSIPQSIRTIYGYSKYVLGISPRGDAAMPPKLVAEVTKGAPVEIGKVTLCRVSGSQVQSIVGKWPFVVIGLSRPDMEYFLKRVGADRIDGRLPEPGKPEAIVSDPVARNRGLKVGSTLLSPKTDENYSPHVVKVVGIAHTQEWLMLNDIAYQRANHLPPIDAVLVFAKNVAEQDTLDRWAFKKLKGQRAQPFAYFELEQHTNDDFQILYRILDVVIGTLVLVIAVMMGMLMNIYQSQRIVEYGLLQAMGYTRRRLLRRALAETIAVLLFGWALGLGLATLLLRIVDATLMAPHAFVLTVFDVHAVTYTACVPVAILVVAATTVTLRFRKFDPVSIVERRLL
jgi:ABC-type lipoprotein release transport system permease subunit